MALTKVTKSGLANDSVDADKLEDGTIVASDINDGTITNAKLAGSIENAKLANSSITVNGSSVSLGGSITSQHINWQSVVTADGSTETTATSGYGYFIDTTNNTHTINLPSSPSAGDYVAIKDYAETFGTNALTIGRNGSNIQGVANNSEISTNRASVVLVYVDATKGWVYTNESNVADLAESPEYVTATGGTVTTSSDDKIHTFTSSGCFVVSNAGSIVGTLGSTTVEYLVVGGGGGSGHDRGGGGGAGGHRTNHTNCTPSPRTGGLSVSVQTYPVTVGGGGGGGTPSITPGNGSNSVFSTITSAGGGYGARQGDSAGNGGSGGGGPGTGGPGGTGNTPPVSPSQGNNGGAGNGTESGPRQRGGGGGGGAGAVGTSATTSQVGDGGNGVASDITASSVTRAGGGGGGGQTTASTGGSGGGAGGPGNSASGVNGTANTGGGAGGGGCSSPSGATGGSGLVVIRYKYQN